MSVFPDSEWPPSVGDQYIRLALIERTNHLPTDQFNREMQEDLLRGKVDKVEGDKKAIDIPGIFAGPEQGKQLRVLVDGAPGVGKTTLCRKISKDWGCEGFLCEYKLVVLLHLRDLRIAKATRIEDFFYHDDPELQAEVVKQVRKTSGAGVLLIFDGFDELSEEERMERSLFLDIIKGEVLSQCSVLVSSRPYASESLQCLHSVSRRVEVLGFKEKQIYECVKNTIKTKSEALVSILRERVDIISLCYSPLNCAILLYVYQQLDYALPSTLTQLFEIFILNASKRELKLQGAHGIARRIRDLVSIPPPFGNDLDHLCKLAFNGLVRDKMVFQYEEIEESKLLGLMTAFKSFSSVGDNITYQFLHLTIQEFLAARWVATHMSPEQQATFFKEHLSDDRFRTMLLFLSGITKLDDSSFRMVFSAELDFNYEKGRQHTISTEELFFRLVHFLYESQNTTHCHTLACAIHEQTIILNTNASDFLFLTFAQFLGRSSCTWKRLQFGGLVRLSNNNFFAPIFHSGFDKVDILQQQLEKSSVSVQQLHVTIDPFGVFTIKTLPRIIGIPAFKHLEKLEIIGSLFSLSDIGLVPSSIPLSSSDFESLHCLIRNGHLEELILRRLRGVDDKVVECIGQELAVSKTLRVLNIVSAAITSSGLCSLFRALQQNKSVETLDMHVHMCGDVRELGLAVESALRVNETLQVLSLTMISPTKLAQYPENLYGGLFRGIASNNSTLKSLTIVDESFVFSEEVASSLIRMLHNNKSLTSLSIRVDYLPSNLLDVLAVGLEQNSSLTRLCVESKTASSGTSSKQLTIALCQNSSLKTLVLDLHGLCKSALADLSLDNPMLATKVRFDNALGVQSFASLLHMLMVNKSLTSLTLVYHFPEDQLKEIARRLVLNGNQCKMVLGTIRSLQEHYESIIQEEVEKFRREMKNVR